MRQKKYLYDFVIQIALIFVVSSLFKMSPSKVQASFWASTLFVLMPVSMMMREWIFYRFQNKIWWGTVLQFWIFFALPIFAIRVMNPHTSFDDISVGPVPAQMWHKVSTYSYLILMLVTLFSWWKYRDKIKKP